MRSESERRGLPTLAEEVRSGKYNFKYPLQRPSGQWNALQKAELIDSVLREYLIDPITIVVSMIDETIGDVTKLDNATIGGVQRVTNFVGFMNGEYRLSKKLDDVPFTTGEETSYLSKPLWGKKFEELDEEIKNKLSCHELPVDFYYEAMNKEITELFRRKDSGRPLTNAQKNSVNTSNKLYGQILSILNVDGFTYEVGKKNRVGGIIVKDGKPVTKERKVPNLWKRIFSAGIFKDSENRNLILEVMMLASGYSKEHEFGFRNEDIQAFISWSGEQKNNQGIIESIINTANSINHRITEEIPNLKKTSIPMFVTDICKVIKYKGGKDKYMVLVKEFSNSYEQNDEYRNLCGSGSTTKENIRACWEVLKNMARKC